MRTATIIISGFSRKINCYTGIVSFKAAVTFRLEKCRQICPKINFLIYTIIISFLLNWAEGSSELLS